MNVPHGFESHLDKMRELCELCVSREGPAATWLAKLKDTIKDVDPILSTDDANVNGDSNLKKSGHVPILGKLFQLLHECLLNHRWHEALQVFHKVVRVPRETSHTIWKVGSELLQHQPDRQDALMKQLYNEVKLLCDLNCKEVALDFVTFLLTRGDNEGARQVIQENIVRHGTKTYTLPKDEYIVHLHRAYTGLLWYIEWKRIQGQIQQHQDDRTGGLVMFFSPDNSQQLEMQLENYCSKAVMCFDSIKGHPGVWDIFVNKHVEMLVFHEKIEEALEVLQQYARQNEANPSAQRNLYLFYKQHFATSENTLQQLKVYAELVPSDSLVLELCEILKKDDVGLAVSYLFLLLDYPCWQTKETPWRMLADCLEAIYIQRKGSRDAVAPCWKSRVTWWPSYHFTSYQLIPESEQFSVNFYKTVVAAILCGQDHEFVLEASKRLSEEELEELNAIRKHCTAGVT